MLESRFRGLPLSRLQYQHRIFANGLSRIISMGQNPYDGAIAHFPDNGGSVGRSRSKHSLAVTIQAAETTAFCVEGASGKGDRFSSSFRS
jgi:hypothetical protein